MIMGKVVSAVPKLILGASDKPSAAPVTPQSDPAADAAKEAADAEQAMAQRRRGRMGTINTSFRGVLDNGSALMQRRTLLGE
jgi:hypothetical protein